MFRVIKPGVKVRESKLLYLSINLLIKHHRPKLTLVTGTYNMCKDERFII